jgi:hypothetical protein
MTTAYCERTIYVATADGRHIAEAIAQLCAREGMVVIPRPKERPRTHYAAMMLGSMRHNTWGVAIIPGIGGWSAIKAAPLDLFLERSPGGGRMRFVELCESLKSPGFLIDVYDGGNGQVLVEADGAGRVELSGWSWHDDWSEGDDPEHLFDFYGTPITYRGDYRGAEDESPPPVRFGLLTHLQYILDRSRNGVSDDFLTDFDAELFCHRVAEELIGSNAEHCRDWQTLQSLRLFKPFSSENASATYFSWPAQDRLEPQASPQELKEEALRKQTRIYDRHGVELHPGDAVMWPAKVIRGIYQGYGTVNNAKGDPEVGRYTSVRTDEGEFVAIEVKAIANELEFVVRGIKPSEGR